MGCGGSKPEDTEGKSRNDAIENQLKKDRMNMRYVFTLCCVLSNEKKERLVRLAADHSFPLVPLLSNLYHRV